jgi:vacuolar-type H+-ATPase subunit F/Vma7
MSRYWFKVAARRGEGLGFRLAGVPVEEIDEGKETERIKALVGAPGLGVLAVEERLLERVPATLLQRVGREGIPVLLPFSYPMAWEEVGRGEQYVVTLIRRAIGYHVKIQR